jgi:hypothetical protein
LQGGKIVINGANPSIRKYHTIQIQIISIKFNLAPHILSCSYIREQKK